MKIMIWDVETTGLPLWKEPSESEGQPHIVELAALLYDGETRELLDTVHHIVKPDGWTIPNEVAAIHGITTERAMDEGIPEYEVVRMFHDLLIRADLRVAHNEQFDARIMRIAFKRFGDGRIHEHENGCIAMRWQNLDHQQKDDIADYFKERPAFCTMKEATKPCNLPPSDKMIDGGAKWKNKPPKLSEAYLHYTGKVLENAHTALADATACADIYFAMQNPDAP